MLRSMRNVYGSWKKERFRSFERRKRRLQRIPWPVRVSAVRKDWYGEKSVTREEWIVLHMGWLPEEREQMIQFLDSKSGYSRCHNCGRGVVSDEPYARSPACGSPRGARKSKRRGQDLVDGY